MSAKRAGRMYQQDAIDGVVPAIRAIAVTEKATYDLYYAHAYTNSFKMKFIKITSVMQASFSLQVVQVEVCLPSRRL